MLRIKRAFAFTLWLPALALFTTTLRAQTRIVSVRIYASVTGPRLMVDGVSYTGPAVLLWPEGSKHEIVAEVSQSEIRLNTIYSFKGWYSNLSNTVLDGGSNKIIISADHDLTSVRAEFAISYAVLLRYFFCPAEDSTCQQHSPGRVYINNEMFTSDTVRYFAAGSTVELQAYPNSGYVFYGWGGPTAVARSNAFVYSFPLNQPQVVTPMFQPARPLQITVQSDPPGLTIFADRTSVVTPGGLQWGYDTVHTLGTLPAQYDSRHQLWIFQDWSDGGAINHEFKMPAGVSVVTVTARFVPGAVVTFLTEPAPLKLHIDNGEDRPNYTFYWAAGTTHSVVAPLEQTDAQGRKYRFERWSSGMPASHQYTVPLAPDQIRFTAVYRPVAVIAIESSPPALALNVDEKECITPCKLDREVGAVVRISAPARILSGEDSRFVFRRWADGAAAERSIVASHGTSTLQAVYGVQNRLAVDIQPDKGAVCRWDPASTDGFYDIDSQVTLRLQLSPGYRFAGWQGDLAGARPSGTLSMTAPRHVLARLDPVPYIRPAGVRNGAGETPVEAVAPGSVISVFGASLAPRTEVGPEGPLAQTIAGVTVRVGDTWLPLFMVSPEEIRAQLPSALDPGAQTLAVRWDGKPEITAEFTVARNAPGLFYTDVDGRAFGVFLHGDGTPVSSGAPAQRGETVTLLGTGLGPYRRIAPDGFRLPEAPDFRLTDPVEVVCGDTAFEPDYAGVAAGTIGVQAVRFRLGAECPSGTTASVRVRAGGVESNTVLLPIE